MPETLDRVRPRAVGAIAAAALIRAHGVTAPVPSFPDAPYRLAAGELIWIGRHGAMHPRAVFVDQWRGGDILDVAAAAVSQAPATGAGPGLPLRRNLDTLLDWCSSRRPASGFAPLLWGGLPMFPMLARAPEALALARAIAPDNPHAFVAAATRLIGVGHGLTPSGDDFVGAALFALHHWRNGDERWSDAAARLYAVARERTHAISATLFADLARGASFTPLHALMHALAADTPDAMPGAMLEDLVAIGHSSGWDMLAGIVAASGGSFPIPA